MGVNRRLAESNANDSSYGAQTPTLWFPGLSAYRDVHDGAVGNQEFFSVHRVVFGHNPVGGSVLQRQREKTLVDASLGWARVAGALSAIVKNYEWGGVFPVDQFPRQEWVLRFRFANVASIFLVVIVLPFCQEIVAVPVAQFAQELIGSFLRGTVAQRIHLDADGKTG